MFYDHKSNIAISHGLALARESNERSLEFAQKAKSTLLGKELQKLVQKVIPNFPKSISEIVASIILRDITFVELRKWKSRY
ncbi:MAG: hypothetical protein O4861_20530 [Trichodesmium sp. St16_bin4-tuft]|nr:hypothetical protein [Trichodesmium sp. MAG_R01]MDE5068550.1 hypothetical protein [Trichodesmium sp. St4_bin8_1]MDE5073807.1 hypothetical protein [Trichodesmium sp. St5_bin8]MDE5076883.1 hypothetical protein [Trichodesmium sp. St2_bin6]MDE5100589.1 hypothetical protein [Trichodesmium sp. St16_bin4-tuft]MDE5101475.1 hypothetical protein [Trichodesmium sp. St19_bin2]